MFPMPLLNPIIIPAAVKQSSAIIFLHGLGDTGQTWSQVLQMVRPPHSKVICPNASIQNVTLNNGLAMPAWYDLRPLDQPKDEFGIKSAAAAIEEVIENEIAKSGISESKIVLGGFSQGGSIALYTALHLPFKIGGVLALSTWLPLQKNIVWDKVQKPPILQCHGEDDELVSLRRAEKTARALTVSNKDFRFNVYSDLGHNVANIEELEDIRVFLEGILSSTTENNKKLQ